MRMEMPNSLTVGRLLRDPRKRSFFLCSFTPAIFLLCGVFFLKSSQLTEEYVKFSRLGGYHAMPTYRFSQAVQTVQPCKSNQFKSSSESSWIGALPKGIVTRTTDLEMRTLMGARFVNEKEGSQRSLLAMAVGIKQKKSVDQIVKKFLSCNFAVMLFHYDGVVDKWSEFDWNSNVIHVSAKSQTKWWFAKRFLHPDIVSEYKYIFLWDEDIDVRNFHPQRYLQIVEDEGLEISQPALDGSKSEVHHQITLRSLRTKVHRRMLKRNCNANSTGPPCTGWVEMMVPVFSRASWKCVWYMIQNDLIHAWGLDMKLGYCAQGDRTAKVGIVDAEYVIHKGIPSLGQHEKQTTTKEPNSSSEASDVVKSQRVVKPRSAWNDRLKARHRSYKELIIFKQRWVKASEEDSSWQDPYPEST